MSVVSLIDPGHAVIIFPTAVMENGFSEPISKEITLPINLGFLQFYSFVLGLGVFQTSMSFAGTT